jgi:hypothetical protein
LAPEAGCAGDDVVVSLAAEVTGLTVAGLADPATGAEAHAPTNTIIGGTRASSHRTGGRGAVTPGTIVLAVTDFLLARPVPALVGRIFGSGDRERQPTSGKSASLAI